MIPGTPIDIADLQRINLVGTSASGKSTFGKQLADLLSVPYVQMDRLYHGPGWTEAEPDVFRSRLTDATAGPRWVLDGNYHSKTFDIKWSRATLIIWLDISFSLNMYRAIRRSIQRSWTQKELWPGTGNRETFRRTLCSSESMILWTAMSHGRLRKRYSMIEADPPAGVKFLRLKNQREIDRLTNTIRDMT